jgi:uncharacterized membrane protein (UPF0127 family)
MGTGLMFRRRESVEDTAWVFDFRKQRSVSVTMWFVFFPIDILLLDEHRVVVELKNDVRPWSWSGFTRRGSYLVELNNGSIERYGINEGDVLSMLYD